MPTLQARAFRFAGNRLVAALLALGVVLLLFAVVAATLTLGSITRDTDKVEHTLEVQATINRLAAANEQVETGRRGFIIQPDPSFLNTIRKATTSYEAYQSRLASLIADNPVQIPRASRLEALDAERQVLIDTMLTDPQAEIARVERSDFDEDRGVHITREIRAIAARMAETEKGLLSRRNQNQLASLIQFYLVGGAALFLLIAVLGTVIVLVLRYNRELTMTQDQLRTVNEGLEDAVAVRTAELTRANEEIQRFAYIVSHDLRSPLVNVLGFTAELDEARKIVRKFLAELFERQPELRDEMTWLAVDEDLPEALGFIRSSTEKMDRLINSILELSRQGRRPLNPEKLDMEALALGVADTLHQRALDAGATVTVGEIPSLVSDRLAIEQVLANLTENAIKYLSPARAGEIAIEGERVGRMVRIDVRDNGRGIAPADHQRVFDLFRRAGTQDQPGEGIGLANVRALVYRLGGTITVESELDRGSTFRVLLPATFVATDTAA